MRLGRLECRRLEHPEGLRIAFSEQAPAIIQTQLERDRLLVSTRENTRR